MCGNSVNQGMIARVIHANEETLKCKLIDCITARPLSEYGQLLKYKILPNNQSIEEFRTRISDET